MFRNQDSFVLHKLYFNRSCRVKLLFSRRPAFPVCSLIKSKIILCLHAYVKVIARLGYYHLLTKKRRVAISYVFDARVASRTIAPGN